MWKALLQQDPVCARALNALSALLFFFLTRKLHENTKRADKNYLLLEQVIFKKQQKLDD